MINNKNENDISGLSGKDSITAVIIIKKMNPPHNVAYFDFVLFIK